MSEPLPVLVLEDEYLIMVELEKALTDAGFAAHAVSSGEEALTLFGSGAVHYKALVTDVCLGDSMTGWEVARQIRERAPGFPVVYVTGSSGEEWSSQGVPNSILISKPFAAAQLVTAIANLLNIGSAPTA